MSQRFRVYDVRQGTVGPVRDDLAAHLRSVHSRFRNAIHAETRVYTCRSWRATLGGIQPLELHWNDEGVPGETLLGKIGWSVSPELIEKVEAELMRGESVRLFIFNSDADLCFEQVLAYVDEKGVSYSWNGVRAWRDL